jgi:hypothetical protein
VKPLLTISEAKAISVAHALHRNVEGCVSSICLRGCVGSWPCKAACRRLCGVGGEELGDVVVEEAGELLRIGTAYSCVSEVVLELDCWRSRWWRGKESEGSR